MPGGSEVYDEELVAKAANKLEYVLAILKATAHQHRLLVEFDAADQDKSGDISLDEFVQFGGRHIHQGLSPEQLSSRFGQLDTDGRGAIDRAQFLRFLREEDLKVIGELESTDQGEHEVADQSSYHDESQVAQADRLFTDNPFVA